MIAKTLLENLYLKQGKSMQQIAKTLDCSVHKVQYWLKKNGISTRSISDAIYQWHNPNGDPFVFSPPITNADYQLYGMGIGLYWGEGTKSNLAGVRLGNTDPHLLRIFMDFLMRFYRVKRKDFRFGLQIFSDTDPGKALDFWMKSLKVSRQQFHRKIIVTRSGSLETYRRKNQHGVATVHYHNTKLRNLLNEHLAAVAQG